MASWHSRLTSGFESWFPLDEGTIAEADLSATYQITGSVESDLVGVYDVGDAVDEPLGWFSRTTDGFNTWAGAAPGSGAGVIDGELLFPIAVEATLTAAYSVALTAQADLVGTYTVRNSATQDLAATWNVTAPVTSDLVAVYVVNDGAGPVEQDLVATYSLLASAERDLVALYSLGAGVSEDLVAVYAITDVVQQDLTATYTLLTSPLSASNDLVATWDVLNGAQRDLIGTYDLLATTAQQDLTAVWVVRASAEVDLVTFWQTQAGVFRDFSAIYGVAGVNLKRRAKISTYGPQMVVYEPQETEVTSTSGSEAQAFQ